MTTPRVTQVQTLTGADFDRRWDAEAALDMTGRFTPGSACHCVSHNCAHSARAERMQRDAEMRGASCTHEHVRQVSEHDVECIDCGQVSA